MQATPSASTQARGDSVNVVNSSFHGEPAPEEVQLESIPLWERRWCATLAKVLAGLIVLLVLVFSVLKPLIRGLLAAPRVAFVPAGAAGARQGGAGGRTGGRSAARLRTTGRAGARHGRAGSEARAHRS